MSLEEDFELKKKMHNGMLRVFYGSYVHIAPMAPPMVLWRPVSIVARVPPAISFVLYRMCYVYISFVLYDNTTSPYLCTYMK